MALGKRTFFISGVTSEFGKARTDLAKALRRRNDVIVRIQEEYPTTCDSDGTLLGELHNQIRDSNDVICLIGARRGAFPPGPPQEKYREFLPNGVTRASYTQWEFFFARKYRQPRDIHLYWADSEYEPDDKSITDDEVEAQRAHRDYIISLGLNRPRKFNRWDLPRGFLVDLLHDTSRDRPLKPTNLHEDGMPQPLHGGFIGTNAIRRLHRALDPRKNTDGKSRVALSGMCGVGKTQTAVEYAYRHRDQYTARFLISAGSPAALNDNFARLAGYLELPKTATVYDVGRRLAADPTWLLILDGVDTNDTLDAAMRLFNALERGHVVITTQIANLGDIKPRVVLAPWSEANAAKFLLIRTRQDRPKLANDETIALVVARDLGCLPRPLREACDYITGSAIPIGLEDFHRSWRRTGLGLPVGTKSGVAFVLSKTAATVTAAIERIEQPHARLVLDRLALFAPAPIPGSLFNVPAPGLAPGDCQEALNVLVKQSLITRDVQARTITVPRPVQYIVQRNARARNPHQLLGDVLSWVRAAIRRDAERSAKSQLLVLHATVIENLAAAAGLPR